MAGGRATPLAFMPGGIWVIISRLYRSPPNCDDREELLMLLRGGDFVLNFDII